LVLVEQQLTAIVDRNHLDLRSTLRGELLPRHNVGVVFQQRDDDFVAFADVLHTPGLGHQIDCFGCTADEEDLVGRSCTQEALYLVARRLVGISRPRRQFMRRTVNVGVLVGVEMGETVDHGLRLLRRRGVVEQPAASASSRRCRTRPAACR